MAIISKLQVYMDAWTARSIRSPWVHFDVRQVAHSLLFRIHSLLFRIHSLLYGIHSLSFGIHTGLIDGNLLKQQRS